MAVAAMLEEIDRYCCDEKLLITYQWLSRKLNVPSDTSKRLLAQYAQSKGEQVQPLFFVSGRAKGGGSAHSIKIGTDVDATKAHFEQVSSVHVYSVQLKIPTDPTDLFQVDHASRKDEFEQPPGVANPLRDNRWSRTQFEFMRTERSVAPAVVAPKAEAAHQPKVERSLRPAAASTAKQNKPSMFPQMPAKSSKPNAAAHASEAPATSQSKPLKKGQSGLASFFKKSAATVPADPAKPKAPMPAAASLNEDEGRDDEDGEGEDDDGAVRKPQRGKAGQSKRRRVAYISSDSEDEENEEVSARQQAEAEEQLRQREAAAEEDERRAAATSAQQESRKRPMYSEDEDADEEDEEEQEVAQDGQRQDAAALAPTEDAQGSSGGQRIIRKKRSRTFMNDKGFITTEEFWEETVIDENGVEGETRVVDAATESVSAQTDTKKPTTLDSARLQVPHKKKSDAVASESKPSAAETKPNKKSKKAAGTRNIMSFFGKK